MQPHRKHAPSGQRTGLGHVACCEKRLVPDCPTCAPCMKRHSKSFHYWHGAASCAQASTPRTPQKFKKMQYFKNLDLFKEGRKPMLPSITHQHCAGRNESRGPGSRKSTEIPGRSFRVRSNCCQCHQVRRATQDFQSQQRSVNVSHHEQFWQLSSTARKNPLRVGSANRS